MRTNPPGEEMEEGEGKKPTVVGEPGGLEKEKRDGMDGQKMYTKKINFNYMSLSIAMKNHKVLQGVAYKLPHFPTEGSHRGIRGHWCLPSCLIPQCSVINYPCPRISPWKGPINQTHFFNSSNFNRSKLINKEDKKIGKVLIVPVSVTPNCALLFLQLYINKRTCDLLTQQQSPQGNLDGSDQVCWLFNLFIVF